MGDIADLVLEGVLDMYTGEYIGDPCGYPRTLEDGDVDLDDETLSVLTELKNKFLSRSLALKKEGKKEAAKYVKRCANDVIKMIKDVEQYT